MAKRLLFLGLLCAAVTLMMGLMVSEAGADAAPPRFGSYETPFLAPAPASPSPDAAAPEWAPQAEDGGGAPAASPRSCGAHAPADRKPPLLARFEAFHLPDRAG
ncbi:MAG TPA: hypothetical protein VLA21_11070 [Candidatus Limnocylindria bacterium]|nr:hypothetical protein [Candidatus Limnocylindria bacterium]